MWKLKCSFTETDVEITLKLNTSQFQKAHAAGKLAIAMVIVILLDQMMKNPQQVVLFIKSEDLSVQRLISKSQNLLFC